METIFDKSLKMLFLSKPKDIVKFSINLSSEEKKELNTKYKKIIPTLKEACKFRYDRDISNNTFSQNSLTVTVSNLLKPVKEKLNINDMSSAYNGVVKNIDNLDEYIEKNNIGFYFFSKNNNLLFNILILSAGIYEPRSLFSLFKMKSNDTRFNYNENEKPFFEKIIKVLLFRKEKGIDEVLIKFFDEVDKLYTPWMVQNYNGLSKLILEVIDERPNIKEDLARNFGKCLTLDIAQKNLSLFSSEVIFSALEYENFTPETPLIISEGYWSRKKEVLELITLGKIAREKTIEITLDKLTKTVKIGALRYWNKFYNDLEIKNEEKDKYQEKYFNLISSLNSTSIQIGLDEIKELIKTKKFNLDYSILIENLSYNLNNITKKVSETSFKLLKLLFKDHESKIIECIIKNIYVADNKLRANIIDFITTKKLNEEQKIELSNFYYSAELNSIEKEKIEQALNLEKESLSLNIEIQEISDTSITLKAEKDVLPIHKQNYYQLIEAIKLKSFENIKSIKLEEPFIYGEKLDFSENESDFILKIKETSKKWRIENDYEIFFYEALKFKEIKDKDRAIKLLSSIFEAHDKNEASTQFYNHYWHRNIILCMLTSLLVKDKSLNSYSYESLKKITETSTGINHHYLRLFLLVKKILENNYSFTLLSTPTYKSGWIDIKDFYQRFEKIPQEHIIFDDLVLALFRTTNINKNNIQLQEKIISKTQLLKDNFMKNALFIKFGNDIQIETAISFFVTYFSKNKPNDHIIFTKSNNKYNDFILDETNMAFRLFNASLLGRFGLVNLIKKFPLLSKIDISNFLIHEGVNYYNLPNPVNENILDGIKDFFSNLLTKKNEHNINPISKIQDKEKSIFIKKVFWNEEQNYLKTIDISNYAENKEQYIKEKYSMYNNDIYLKKALSSFMSIHSKTENIFYPQFLIFIDSGYEFMSEDSKNIIIFDSWKLPNIIQNIFDYNCVKLSQFDILDFSKTEALPKMISSGAFLQVDISNNLDTIFSLLISKHSEVKKIAFDIIQESIKTGRMTYKKISDSFTKLLIETSKGFKYLKESLDSISMIDSYYEKIVLFSLETFFEKIDFNNLESKNTSQILDIFYDMLTRLNRNISSTKALNNLKSFFDDKKKSPLKNKIKIILDLNFKNRANLEEEIIIELINSL
ncbi:MAG: DUF6493 family protein [Cyanobacteriota bacterium]